MHLERFAYLIPFEDLAGLGRPDLAGLGSPRDVPTPQELRRMRGPDPQAPDPETLRRIREMMQQLPVNKAQLAPQHMDSALQDWPHGDPAFKDIRLIRDPSHDMKQMEAIMKSAPGFAESLVPRV